MWGEHGLLAEHFDEGEVNISQHTMKIFTVKEEGATEDEGTVLEGQEVLAGLGNVPQECAALLGFIYALNLQYPKPLTYTLEVFQKLFMEQDGLKLSPKVLSLKKQLLIKPCYLE
ncbi:hypothetical protein AMEX_G16993 [Astyanax mexicanus]|uniref:Uncharacterized protein n=1 Tax=Astyanax mexicanus TaxID=7994 RepID=A0A8T2LGA9_ASTMX|nr:hypothetical protein AMEX_G16993 [Astyanax mexicanus]